MSLIRDSKHVAAIFVMSSFHIKEFGSLAHPIFSTQPFCQCFSMNVVSTWPSMKAE